MAFPNQINYRYRGFSLVELMVGMLLGLIGIIAIYQVFAVFEGYKRTTTGSSDAGQSGAVALFTVERDLRMSGFGINQPALLGCTVNAYSSNLPAPGTFSFLMVPVVINVGLGIAPDSITVTYGNSEFTAAPTSLTQNMPSPSATYQVANRFGMQTGDLVITAESGKPCTLAEVTDLPGTPGSTTNVIHNNGNYVNAAGTSVQSAYNYPGGLGTSYTTNGLLFDIGSAPVSNTYSIVNGQLIAASNIGGGNVVVAAGIVQMKAQYGMDDGISNGSVNHGAYTVNDGVIDRYVNSAPASWTQVLSVRLGIVARSELMEKADPATGICNITTVAPTWAGGTLDVSADPNWMCYRYKVFETSVPLRNMLWTPQ